MDIFNKKRIAELEAELARIQSSVNEFYHISAPKNIDASAWVAVQAYSLYSRARDFSDLVSDAASIRAELESKNKKIAKLKAQRDRAVEAVKEVKKEAEQLERAKIAETQLAEMQEVVNVGDTFKKLGVEHVVSCAGIDSGYALIECEYAGGGGDRSYFEYEDIDLLKALVEKK